MIRMVRITNYRSETLEIDLANPYSSGFAITNIDGLGPNKATINTVDIATNDGSLFNSARVDPRNIVFKIVFLGTDIEELRRKTYKYFPLKKELTFEVITDNRTASITGYVESNEPDIFSSKESTSISIICPYPYFHSVGGNDNEVVFFGEEPLFEFAFSNEGSSPAIEFGEITQITEGNVGYYGDANVGVLITIHATGAAKNIRIDNIDTRESMAINIELEKGDDLIINTVTGKKSIKRLRKGEYTNILNSLDKDADWFVLSKGDNAFAYQAEEGLNNLQFKVSFDILYEGV